MDRTNHHRVGAEYLDDVTLTLVAVADDACVNLAPYKGRFDTLVCTGLSGTILTPLLSIMLDIPFCIVRKKGENNHSGYPVEGLVGKRALFIDDFIDTGDTKRHVFDTMRDHGCLVIGGYLYASTNKVRIG
jgi:adenine/guanine phosphoribosyltransferase-like PRPP-binding protein